MKQLKVLSLLIVLLFAASLSYAGSGNYFVNGSSQGQYTDINAVRACGSSARSGLKAVIDAGCARQTSTTGTTAAQTLIQSSTVTGTGVSTVPPVFDLTCTAGALNTCSCYTSTGSSKVGAIPITVNGVVRFIDLKSGPN